ncbi:MAG TPA: uracil-DNA glycosylase [Chloroflexota bacterium]|nr:uracil-DNA glycosylase [Chloroflexota bacterium]
MDAEATLAAVAAEVAACRACRLAETRTLAVPGAGRVGTGVVFVGEAPGRHEDACGMPFVGRCGQVLDRWLGELGMPWRELGYLVPVVKCRPPRNRDPRPDELAACRPHLVRQLEALRPRVVITLGRFGLNAFLPKAVLSEAHGRWQRATTWPGGAAPGEYALFPLPHPAAAMRFPRWREAMLADLAELARTLPAVLDRPAPGGDEAE